MKPAFLLMCYLSGISSGSIHFANINDCLYYKDRLDGQSVKVGGEQKVYDCYCKLVMVNSDKVTIY